jgi:long-chain acyl-CoA synthetase
MLLDNITNKNHLSFTDAKSMQRFKLSDLLFDLDNIIMAKRSLTFLYVNNNVHQVGLYFSFLKSNSTIALLNGLISNELKQQLEDKYKPNFIYDSKRDNINFYYNHLITSATLSINLFINKNKSHNNIHPKVKLLLSTSGTTGSPKFVKLSEENIIENAKSIIDYLPIVKKDVTPLNLPFYYSYGLSVLHSNAMVGANIVCGVSDILQREFWSELTEHGFTSIAGVPYVYEMLNRVGFRKKQYPSIKYCTQAGGNLNKKTKELFLSYFTENHIDFYVMYGQTEATARISFVPPQKLASNITSIGIPISNGNLEIDTVTNELLYKGPNVFGGYSERVDDLTLWEEINLLHTGDLAVEKEGFFYITGRLKRFIKIFGNRVNLDEIETILKNNFSNVLFAALGLHDKTLIITVNDERLMAKNIKDFIQECLKIHPSVVKVIYLEVFPLTSNGKVDYNEILTIYESK